MAKTFSKMNVTVTMTGEEWFSVMAHIAKRELAPRGLKLLASGMEKMRDQVVKASDANPEIREEAKTFIVVENAGYEGEREVKRCVSYKSATGWLGKHYSESERERLHVAICCESDNGERSYEI